MGFFTSLRKSGKVLRIARVLGGEHHAGDFLALLEGKQRDVRSEAEQDLYTLSESDRECRAVLEAHNADRKDLEQLYALLLRGGAGQWVGTHYVPVSAIAYAKPLQHLLANRNTTAPAELAYQIIDIISRGRFA